jgi:myo-inositol-hexaphosphate 3-phosphohydrolase
VTNAYIGNFIIIEGDDVDGIQECDGATDSNLNLGGEFEGGLLVVQDG